MLPKEASRAHAKALEHVFGEVLALEQVADALHHIRRVHGVHVPPAIGSRLLSLQNCRASQELIEATGTPLPYQSLCLRRGGDTCRR